MISERKGKGQIVSDVRKKHKENRVLISLHLPTTGQKNSPLSSHVFSMRIMATVLYPAKLRVTYEDAFLL